MNPGQSLSSLIGSSAEFAARPFSSFLGTIAPAILPKTSLRSIPDAISPASLQRGMLLSEVLGATAMLANLPGRSIAKVVESVILPLAAVKLIGDALLRTPKKPETENKVKVKREGPEPG